MNTADPTVMATLRTILSTSAKRRGAMLLLIMTIGAFFEALGIGLIVPFLTALGGGGTEFGLVAAWREWLNPASSEEYILWTGGALLAGYSLKNIYLAWMHWVKLRFTYDEQVAISQQLFSLYLHAPHLYHVSHNSSEMLRNVTDEVRKVCSHVLLAVLSLIVELLVVLAIVALLLFAEPIIAPIVLGIFALIGGGFLKAIRKRASELGRLQLEEGEGMIRWVNQGLGSVKETKVRGAESFFIDRFVDSARNYADAMLYHQFVKQLPVHVIETLGLATMMLLIAAMMTRGTNIDAMLPSLGLFGMAAIRLLPSVTRIMSSVTSIKLFIPSLIALSDDIVALSRQQKPSTSQHKIQTFNHAIEVQGLSYQFPGRDAVVLHDVTISIPRGSSVAFVGSSGAGKTTLADLILGLLDPTSGDILVDGVSIHEDVTGWRQRIGYIAQSVYLMDASIRHNVAFAAKETDIDDEHVWRCLAAAQLAEFVRQLPGGLDTVIGEHGTRLSGGQRQRIGIARALYPNPDVLVLDEATSALDTETEREITDAVNALRGDRTVLVIAHRFATIRHCDQIVVLAGGRVRQLGTYDELMLQDGDFRRLAGEREITAEPAHL